METILKANRIPFRALDIATDEKARMLWGRRAGKDETGRARKIPGLVQMGLVVGVKHPVLPGTKETTANVFQDLVEVEEWNEYGELKQHVKIVPIGGTPSGSAAATPTTTPSKAPAVAKENVKPAPATESSKLAEPAKTDAAAPSSFTLAMRQASQEAAQKAKDNKKKAPETLEGVGEADPAKDVEKSAVTPAPIAVLDPPQNVKSNTVLQSPSSSTWRIAPGGKLHIPKSSIDMFESLQSPNSTAWKPFDRPFDTDPPIIMHRGSSISLASTEEIKQVEEDEKIMEEDEDAVED
jgi:hypothetical protein